MQQSFPQWPRIHVPRTSSTLSGSKHSDFNALSGGLLGRSYVRKQYLLLRSTHDHVDRTTCERGTERSRSEYCIHRHVRMTCAHELSLKSMSRVTVFAICHNISVAMIVLLHMQAIIQNCQPLSNKWSSTRARCYWFEHPYCQCRICVTKLLMIRSSSQWKHL